MVYDDSNTLYGGLITLTVLLWIASVGTLVFIVYRCKSSNAKFALLN